MTKHQIEELRNKYQKKADKNFQNYQETGTSRYLSEYRKADDITNALDVALKAADDHDRLVCLSCDISMLANDAQTKYRDSPEKAVKDLIDIAADYGLIRK